MPGRCQCAGAGVRHGAACQCGGDGRGPSAFVCHAVTSHRDEPESLTGTVIRVVTVTVAAGPPGASRVTATVTVTVTVSHRVRLALAQWPPPESVRHAMPAREPCQVTMRRLGRRGTCQCGIIMMMAAVQRTENFSDSAWASSHVKALGRLGSGHWRYVTGAAAEVPVTS